MESDFKQRARAYWVADGIPLLLGAGMYLLIVAALRFLWVSALKLSDFKGNWFLESFVGPFVGFAIATLPLWSIALAIWFWGNWEDLVEWFKVRLTYPRTGYVLPPSYWDGEPSAKPRDPSLGARSGRYRHDLDLLGGFWVWAIIQLWWRPSVWLLLIILLLIRSYRYAIYPDPRSANTDAKQKYFVFLKGVLNSFWIWFWAGGLLSHATSGFGRMAKWLACAVVTLIAIRILHDVASIKLFHVFTCCALCAALFYRGTAASTTLALFVPGFYAASIGMFRLVRHLRANPVPQT